MALSFSQAPQQQDLGEDIGKALNQSLQNVAQYKLQQFAQRQSLAEQMRQQQQQRERLTSGLSPLVGPEQAAMYSQLPESILAPIVKQKLTEPNQTAYAQALQGLLGGEQAPQLGSLTGDQARQLTQLSLQKQQADEARKLREATQASKAKTQKQKSIVQQNKPYLNTLSKGVSLADNLETIANELLALENTGKISTGAYSHLTNYLPGGSSLQSAETQRYDALSNELASILAGQSGTATNFKIKLAQSMKPNITQRPETRRALIQDILNKAHKIKLYDQAKDYVIAKHGNEEPKNIEGLIKKSVADYEKLEKRFPANEYEEGTIVEDRDTKAQLVNGHWELLAE